VGDRARADAFLPETPVGGKLFVNEGSLSECFKRFLPRADTVDTVLCANGFAAVSLVKHLKREAPALLSRLHIISCDQTLLSRYYQPHITSVDLNFEQFGKAAISVAELAKKKNYKVGIVTTVTINHATPASFYGHRISRSQYYELGVDLVNSNFDYFAGGGVASPTGKPAKKGDPAPNLPNIYDLAAKKGYKVLKEKKAFMALKPGSGKILYSGAPGKIPAAIDAGKEDITLAELTAKGLELLKNEKGFFLMVEGGTIDSYGHGNEAASNLREVLALDEAVKEAVKFMKKHPQDTLIVVTGDHETGGMTMGFAGSGYAMHMERLAHQKVSIGKFRSLLKDARKAKKDFSYADFQKMVTRYFGLQFTGDPKKEPMALSSEQKKALEEAFQKNRLPGALKLIMSQKAGIGWTTGAHTALPVLTTATGVQAKRFSGFIDNTDIANILKSLLK
jgi:alkaline phosphatase